MRRSLAVAVLTVAASAVFPLAGQADTHLSWWKNESRCEQRISYQNGTPTLIASSKIHDYGPFPGKDPEVVGWSGCASSFKVTYKGNFQGNARCGALDPGPFWFEIENGSSRQPFCYCITLARIGYLNSFISNSGVRLEHGPGTYACIPQ